MNHTNQLIHQFIKLVIELILVHSSEIPNAMQRCFEGFNVVNFIDSVKNIAPELFKIAPQRFTVNDGERTNDIQSFTLDSEISHMESDQGMDLLKQLFVQIGTFKGQYCCMHNC